MSIRNRIKVKPNFIKQEIKNIENGLIEHDIMNKTFIERLLYYNKHETIDLNKPSRRGIVKLI
jgi:hypothetical protein